MYSGNDILVIVILGVMGFVIPGVLTIWNLYNAVSEKPKHEIVASCLTIFIGGFFYMLLHLATFDIAGDWYKTVNSIQYHNPLSSEYYSLPGWIVLLGFIGYFVLLLVKAQDLPPLISVISICMLILLNVFQIAYALQLSKNVHGLVYLLYVYHANILILSARVIHRHMREQVECFRAKAIESDDHKHIRRFWGKIDTLSKYSILVFVALFFIVAVIEIILVIIGQGLDAPIKTFTDTADWTFSRQIPPPPTDYDGHYLCTVAAGGHEKVVKPLRLGTRKGQAIVVNRQLSIANAFEEVIQERLPGIHRKIRHVYDTYGYPLSRKITSPFKADLVYFAMKPPEWFFLIVLYIVDLRPEQRIARQYTKR